MYGSGISKIGTILDTAHELKIVDRAGAWYSFEGEKLGQGRENSKAYLNENSDILKEIEDRVRQSIGQLKSSGDAADIFDGDPSDGGDF